MWRSIQVLVISIAVVSGLVFGCGERPGEREFENAVRQLDRGNLVRARDLFEKSVNKRPGHEVNAHAYQYLGYITWRLGDPGAAVTYFESSRRANAQLFEPVYSLGVIAYQAGDMDRARAMFSDAAQLQPRDPRPLEYLARTHQGDTAHRDARRTLYQALARAPHSSRILTSLALISLEDSGAPAAVSYLMQALEKNPSYGPALYNLARIYADWPNQEEHAVEFYRQYLAVAESGDQRARATRELAGLLGDGPAEAPTAAVREPRLPAPTDMDEPAPPPRPRTLDDVLADATQRAAEGQIEQAVSICLRAATEARQRQRSDQEERALRHAVQVGPDSARAHMALGRHLAARDQHADALRSLRRATELQPDWAQALVGLADSAVALADYDVALDALRKAVTLEPSDPGPLWSLAELYDESGVRRRAIGAYSDFRRRFAADPRSSRAAERIEALQPREQPPAEPPARPAQREPARNVQAATEAFNRGATYHQRRDWDNALFFYARAIQNDPSFERAHYNTGVVQLERRNLREARDAFLKSIELEPEKVTSRYNLGLVYHEMQQSQAALPHLDAALRADPDFAPAHLLLGVIYSANQRAVGQAKRHYNRFLALQPNDPSAPAVRDWLARN